jgi:hypothetical protein
MDDRGVWWSMRRMRKRMMRTLAMSIEESGGAWRRIEEPDEHGEAWRSIDDYGVWWSNRRR